MATVGIRKLKANLSAYIREVKAGRTITVTDHGEVVAELRPPEKLAARSPSTQLWQEAVAAGWLIPAERAEDRSWMTGVSPGLPRGTAAELLDAERADR